MSGLLASASVVIPVWNGMQDLPICLPALMREVEAAILPVEIILVDNASTDGAAEYAAAKFPQVTVLRQERNLGFVAGCNAGLRHARGDALILLNQDTEVRPGWLAALLAPFGSDPAVGIAGSKALYPDGAIQHAGGRIDAQGITHHIGRGEADRGQYQTLSDVEYVSGASLAIRRSVYSAVGDLDEGFAPAYYEDVDWSLRARQAGFRVVYAPDSTLVHRERSATSGISDESLFLVNRNRLRFLFKHWPLDRLRDEFLPAEGAWLASVPSTRLVTAMQHAYLYQLLHLGDLVAAREQMLGDCADEIDGMAAILLALRGIYPLAAANVDPNSTASEEMAALLRSAFGRAAPGGFPARLTQLFARLTHQKRLAEVMVAYLAQNNREIAELALELYRLQRRIEQLERSRDVEA